MADLLFVVAMVAVFALMGLSGGHDQPDDVLGSCWAGDEHS
ncbi:hypothetical protein ACOBQB_34160 [Streptomyces sp. G5(2025)]